MDNVKLMDRTDTKFVFHADQLPDLLKHARENYRILEINSKRIFAYQTLYLDTLDNQMYLAHHNGNLNRFKIRYRKYIESDKAFLEVKFKTNKGRTIKTRIKRKEIEVIGSESAIKFIEKNSPFKYDDLEPKLWSLFSRYTLVHKSVNERITVDVNIHFNNDTGKQELPFLSIAEVKQNKISGNSDFIKLLTANKIYPEPISKYCLGRILLSNEIKRNRFKIKLLILNKLHHDNRFYHLTG